MAGAKLLVGCWRRNLADGNLLGRRPVSALVYETKGVAQAHGQAPVEFLDVLLSENSHGSNPLRKCVPLHHSTEKFFDKPLRSC